MYALNSILDRLWSSLGFGFVRLSTAGFCFIFSSLLYVCIRLNAIFNAAYFFTSTLTNKFFKLISQSNKNHCKIYIFLLLHCSIYVFAIIIYISPTNHIGNSAIESLRIKNQSIFFQCYNVESLIGRLIFYSLWFN